VKLLVLVALLGGLLGCSAPRPAGLPTSLPETPAPVRAPVPPTSFKPAARVFDESLLTGKEFLLEASTPSPPVARDPVVGRLTGDKAVTSAVEALFQAADTGALKAEILVPRWADYLQGWAQRFQGRLGKSMVHVGEPLRESDQSLMVPVRLFGGTQEYSGWVVLARDGTSFLISDVQVTEAETRMGPLDPEAPGQLISSPNRR